MLINFNLKFIAIVICQTLMLTLARADMHMYVYNGKYIPIHLYMYITWFTLIIARSIFHHIRPDGSIFSHISTSTSTIYTHTNVHGHTFLRFNRATVNLLWVLSTAKLCKTLHFFSTLLRESVFLYVHIVCVYMCVCMHNWTFLCVCVRNACGWTHLKLVTIVKWNLECDAMPNAAANHCNRTTESSEKLAKAKLA